MKKKLVSVFLYLAMIISICIPPVTAFAEETDAGADHWGGTGLAEIVYSRSALYAVGNGLVIKAGPDENTTNLYYADASGEVSGEAIDLSALSGAENAISGDTANGFDLSDISLWFTYYGTYNGNTNAFSALDIVITMEGGVLRYISGGNADAKAQSITFKMTGGTISDAFNGCAIAANTIYISGGTAAKSLYDEALIYVSGDPQLGGSDGEGIKLSSGHTFYIEGALSGASIYVVPQADFADGTVVAQAAGGYTIAESDLSQLHLTGSYAENKELYLEDGQVKIRAVPTQPHTHPVCGAAHSDAGDHTGVCGDVEWTAFSADLITDHVLPAGNYYLTEDVTLTTYVQVTEGTVSLCLNGHTLTASYASTVFPAVKVGDLNSPATLNICDCGGDGEFVWIGSSSSTSTAAGVGVTNAGTLNLYGGTIRNTGLYGRAVNLTSASGQTEFTIFSMYGGKICHEPTSISSVHGVVYVQADACAINIYGGEVSTNENALYGAIYADSGTYYKTQTTVLIAGGVIKGGGFGLWLGAAGDPVQLTLDGSPAITCADEEGAGIHLSGTDHSPLQVRSGFAPASPISVSDSKLAVFAQPEDGLDSLADYAQYFVSAKEGYFVESNDDGDLQFTACQITEQPGEDNSYTVTANGSPAYQWYPATRAQVQVNTDNATACAGSSFSWRGEWYPRSISDFSSIDIFTIDLRKDDVLVLNITRTEYCNILGISISDNAGNSVNGTMGDHGRTCTVTAPADGTYTLCVSAQLHPGQDSCNIYLTATVTDDVPDETAPLTGQTAKALSTGGLASGTCICQVTWEGKTIRFSDPVAYCSEQTAPAPGEGCAIDYGSETIAIDSGYEISTRNDGTGTAIASGDISNYFGQTIYIRKAETDTQAPSGWTAIDVAARPDAPAAPVPGVVTTDSVTVEPSDAGLEYAVVRKGERPGPDDWQTGNSGELTFPGLEDGTEYEIYARVPGTDAAPASLLSEGTAVTTPVLPGTVRVDGQVTDKDGGGIGGVCVTLKQGGSAVKSVVTDPQGNYSFSGIPAGVYNMVAATDSATVTVLVTVADTGLAGQNIQMPDTAGSGTVNSIVKVEENAPDVVAGGVADVAAAEAEDAGPEANITVTLTVKKEEDADKQAAVDAAIPANSADDVLYLDLSLTKTTTVGVTTSEEAISNASQVLEIVVPYSFEGKYSVTVSRQHGTEPAMALRAVGSRPASPADGTFWADRAGGSIHIYAAKFSIYAIAYTVQNSTGGGSVSGSSRPTYSPVIEAGEHGDVSVSPKLPERGAKVTITPKPDNGYAVEDVTVTDRSGNPVAVMKNPDGTYSFTQPSGKVTIEVTFHKTGGSANCPRDYTCPLAKFTDVSVDAWYHDGVHACLENGLMSSYSDGTFRPNVPIDREQLAVMLYRCAQSKGYDTAQGGMAVREFSDYERVSAYAVDAMTWAVDTGVVGGYADKTLRPQNTATRAQAAQMLKNFLEYAGE